ncbi:MAG: SRPBCC domain-containing protein [Ktedonobacterales bacterium]|nr:SRPBCC domain-containing protein [Ktedonobacterales bacterium]
MLSPALSDDTTLILTCAIPAPPAAVFAAWTQPEHIVRWWPQTAEIDARVGGSYHLGWPTLNQHLRGTYLVVVPAAVLTFTWRWDDATAEGDAPRVVALTFAPDGAAGTRMTLTHGPYAATSADQEIRTAHHLAGWQHFLPKLVALFTTAP